MDRIKRVVEIAHKYNRRDHDSVVVIIGPEGSGKSNLGLHVIDYYAKLQHKKPSIDCIGLNAAGFKAALSKAKKYSAVVFDEAGDGLYSRDAMSPINKVLNKSYMALRGMNLLTVLILPDFFDLDTYFRKHRVRGLFYVYKRGACMFYTKRKIEQIISKCEHRRKIFGVRASFFDTFPKYAGSIAKDYNKLKLQKMRESQQYLRDNDVQEGLLSKKEMMIQLIKRKVPIAQACEIAGCANSFGYKIKKELEKAS